MKKLAGILVVFMAVVMAACGNQSSDEPNQDEVSEVTFTEIISNIKDQVSAELKAEGVDDLSQTLQEADLKDTEDENSVADIWIEKMKLNPNLLAHGTVIAALMSVNADEIILLEAKDEDQVDELKTSLENELAGQVQTWKQYLPEQYEKVKNNKIVTKGKYLLYVTYTNPETIEKAFNDSF
ncbi:DUF4358 domain-containing protein [Sporosarcina sp. BI001-red]|uniref:DUF4358 domain-containing protein n=1 Tax=Sporosarcina sp. BI001-red TaxID=2282866 RepID=UPI000E22A54F|nr:DUF4358 domain-containing protein [Sporosarcina sp. BI001-red]REB05565.1 DUF4358 domain-containing protein [Sporosarcina sp. BI001-red]